MASLRDIPRDSGMTTLAEIAREIGDSIEPVTLPSGRHQTPSLRSIQALVNLADNGGNKRQALLDAGYSQEIADYPSKVFGSPTIKAALERAGLTEGDALVAIKRALVAKTKDGRDAHGYQLEAAEKILNIHGSYAPKKTEGKHTHAVGVFSMKDLRNKMRQEGVDVITHEIEETNG